MNKQIATKIIRDTLERPFNKEQFVHFAKNLLNKIDDDKAFHARGYVPESFTDYVKTYERLGTYTDPENNKIDVLIVYLQKATSLERARTAQRNFVARYLKDRDEKEAALVAFVSPDDKDWRFSLVRMDYILEETPGGKTKVKTELTPARRWSFLVGANESSHTAQSQLVDILADDKNNPLLSDLEKAFSIEIVTKEFFGKYRDLYLEVKKALEDIVSEDKRIRDNFAAESVDNANFAKKLLGQIVFLYFLQKKGWFGVEREEDWGTGPKNFLRLLFEKKRAPYQNFFNEVLEPLFYEALALERTGDFYSRFNCKIPFLNGGLFDPINNYDWVHTDILLSNQLFSNNEKTKEGDVGTGILDVFDRYNFTVKEDEPLEKEVAVDPEMLGKVFENLLEVKDRKSKGTYYTPREIVHYMCQESLINYLDTAVNTGDVPLVPVRPPQEKLLGKPDPQQAALKAPQYRVLIPREDIEGFVRNGEATIEHDTRVESVGKETERYSYKLSETIRQNARLIDEKLANIRVCDPAIGSGAFPVGMMHEIIRARNTLTTYLSDKSERTNYNFKRHAIQNCLYGVDIDPGAVEIAKLRLWLSLVVDEEDIRQIKPLPNLDYKIVCGNSLLGVEKNLFNLELFNELERLKPLHFDETNATKKQEYKTQIDDLINQITNNNQNFDFEVYFSEIFHGDNKGFDVVIANPPYLSAWTMEKQDPEERDNLAKRFEHYKVLTGHWDLYMVFVLQGYEILRRCGILSYILPNSILREKYATSLRKFLLGEMTVDSLLIFGESNVFENVSRKTAVFVIKKDKTNEYAVKIFENSSWQENRSEIKYCKDIEKKSWLNSFSYRFRIDIDDKQEEIIQKIDELSIKVGNICYVNYGAQVSSKQKGKFKKKDVVSDKPLGNAKRFYEGKDLHLWSIKWRGLWLDYRKNKLYGPRTEQLFQNPKIAIRKVSDKYHVIGGAIDRTGMYCDDGVVLIVPYFVIEQTELCKEFAEYEKIAVDISLEYLTAHLLSSLSNFYYRNKFATESLQQSTSHVYPQAVRALPVKKLSLKSQKPFVDLVNQIMDITRENDYLIDLSKQTKVKEYEHQIDQMVYELYGLTPEEISVVEGKA